ncbi:hypothetical protein CEP51_008647 [Fusarium floridanum]|uniref:Uncharacterized protein n=1 Tax=Fusarium floridanum TaxID=1325733 RepID=A0A428RK87_9HYPO|nr:hypothetical protein CEP51_008647 [Fusarium floridanum]
MTNEPTREQVEELLRKEFRALIVFNSEKFEPTIFELLESDGKPWKEFAKMKSGERPPGWIWFHLPSVNLNWLNSLVWQLQCKNIIQTWKGDPEMADGTETVGDGHSDGILSVFKRTFAGHRAVDFPRFDNAQGSEDATFSVAMPFLDSESYGAYTDANNKVSRLKSSKKTAVGPYITTIMPSRTLDESFYVTSNDTTARGRERGQKKDQDQDQVVYRYYQDYLDRVLANDPKRITKSQSRHGTQQRILMVSPLRLWKIGRDVVITAFPETGEETRPFELTTLGHVYQSIVTSGPASAMELVSQIMASLVTAIDGSHHAGLHDSLLTIFEAETSAQTTKQLKLYHEFRELITARIQPSPNTPAGAPPGAPPGETGQSPKAITIIDEEMECFRIVMDIRDELAMISSVLSDQERVMQSVRRTIQELKSGVAENTTDQPTETKDRPEETAGQTKEIKDQPKKKTDQIDAMKSQPTETKDQPKETAGQTKEIKDRPKKKTDQIDAMKSQPSEPELGIARWKLRISNIDKRAQMVEKALSHLLSLKLAVSNLAEAEDTKKLLESSKAIQQSSQGLLEGNNELLEKMKSLHESSQAIQTSSKTLLKSNNTLLTNIGNLQKSNRELQDKADKQSGYLFAFTMVTVIFAPLSFVASFFAIPSHDFPQDGGVSWSQGQIGGGLAISLAVTIVLAVLIIKSNEPKQEKNNAGDA